MSELDDVLAAVGDGDTRVHPDFPTGAAFLALNAVRTMICEAAEAAGHHILGSGIGIGGEADLGSADVGMIVDGVRIEITIRAPRPRQ